MEEISKLTPILYNKNETNFNHNGLGKLTGLLVNEIEEVLNGQFEALFEYPANGRLANKIDNKMLIKAKPNRKDDPHVFRVYDYVLDTISQTYTIYARSKNIDDLGGNMVLDVNINNQTPNQAWNMAKNNALEPVDVTFESDITTRSSVHWERRNLLSVVAGEEGSMVQYWGGEIKHGNGWLWLYRRRGQDNVTTVRHGKNLSGLTATYSTKGLVTAIVPYHTYNNQDESDEEIGIYGDVVKSQYVNNYPHVYYDVVEYTHTELGFEAGEAPTQSQRITALNNKAKTYFTDDRDVDLPSINMEIALEDISQTKEYEHFKDFEQIEIGDTITAYVKEYDVNVTAKVRRVVYDGLTDKNRIVEVGTVSRSIYDDYKELVDNRVDKKANELQEGIDHALVSANGKNTNYYGTADPNEAGLTGQDNDWYFRTNGQEKELWVFRNGMWFLEIDDMTGERIKADVEAAQQEAEDARAQAEELAIDLETGESFFNHAGSIGLASKNADGTINSILNLRDDGTAYLGGSSIILDGDTIVDGTFTVTDSMIASNAQINGAKIADATIGSAKIANLDVGKISGNITNFVSSNWNTAAGGSVTITGAGIQSAFNYAYDGAIRNQGNMVMADGSLRLVGSFTHSHGSTYMKIDADSIYGENLLSNGSVRSLFSINGDGIRVNKLGNQASFEFDRVIFRQFAGIRYYDANARIEIQSFNGVALGASQSNGGFLSRLTVGGGANNVPPFIDAHVRMNMQDVLNMGNNEIMNAYSITGVNNIRFSSTSNRLTISGNGALNILSPVQTQIGHYAGGAITNVLIVSANYVNIHKPIDMNGNAITNQSDGRKKDFILDITINSLSAIESWRFVGFNYKKGLNYAEGRQFGLIAQDTPDLALYDSVKDNWSINSSKQIMMNSHAIQQLAKRESNTNLLASDAYLMAESNSDKIHDLQMELSKANARITELEGAK